MPRIHYVVPQSQKICCTDVSLCDRDGYPTTTAKERKYNLKKMLNGTHWWQRIVYTYNLSASMPFFRDISPFRFGPHSITVLNKVLCCSIVFIYDLASVAVAAAHRQSSSIAAPRRCCAVCRWLSSAAYTLTSITLQLRPIYTHSSLLHCTPSHLL